MMSSVRQAPRSCDVLDVGALLGRVDAAAPLRRPTGPRGRGELRDARGVAAPDVQENTPRRPRIYHADKKYKEAVADHATRRASSCS